MTALDQKKHSTGFSLVEMLIAMVIFAVLSIGLSKSLIYSQQMAEDNLYEATSLTVASSFIEQIKAVSYARLLEPKQVGGKDVIEVVIGNGLLYDLILDEKNELEVPIVTDNSGTANKMLTLGLTPSVTRMDSGSGFWIEVYYEYEHPKTKRVRSQSLRNARSAVPLN
jgi:prepilin-type N-terminal cleavage/methylation domain-containing protein